MTPDQLDEFWIRVFRLRAQAHRRAAAMDELNATALAATRPMRHFVEAFRAAEAREVAEHPDLAELNVQLDSYYGESS
jgi:hypothetical protein